MKAHIHDPNAPELVHFLFTPLSLIYEASRDPIHGNVNLGEQAVSPVLTQEAKQLLLNCLTSKEIELWQALGKNWTTSRSVEYAAEFYFIIKHGLRQLLYSLVKYEVTEFYFIIIRGPQQVLYRLKCSPKVLFYNY